VRLVPGMPVEAYVQLNDRSVLSFLTKPLSDQIARTWRER
jgi:HlyD family secretion protein